MPITNYVLRTIKPRRYFSVLAVFCALGIFAGNCLAQSNLDFLAEKITRGNDEQKRDALFQIRNLETAAASRAAIPALTDKAEIVRATAAFSVVFLPQDEALNVLLPLLGDKKELVRREAAYALGKVRNRNAINPLLQVLQKDKILEVKTASVVALGEIGDDDAVTELVKILQRKPKAEEEFLRRAAARSVGQIAQIIQTNKVEVQTPEKFSPEKYDSVAKPKYPNLIETFPVFQTANDTLIQTLKNQGEPDDVKRETAFALGAIGDKSAIPVLQANRAAKDYYLAQICAEALRKISVSSSLERE